MGTASRLLSALRSGLPPTIRVLSVEPAPPGFHARHSCTAKRYVYSVREGGNPSPFEARWCWAPTRRPTQFDLGAMQRVASKLTGSHDFSRFAKLLPGDPREVVKNMRELRVERVALAAPATGCDADASGAMVTVTATCDRYLWHMMRRIVGTLVEVGLGRMPEEAAAALVQPGAGAGVVVPTAPAQGLCLDEVLYEPGGAAATPA